MIYMNDHWKSASTLDKCLNLVGEYNKELAAKIVELLPIHTDEEYDELERELKKSDDYLRDAEYEVDRLQEQVDELNEEISDLEQLLKEGKISKEKIKFTTTGKSGWAIIQYEDCKIAGHLTIDRIWIELLQLLGYEVENKEISDEEMEDLC